MSGSFGLAVSAGAALFTFITLALYHKPMMSVRCPAWLHSLSARGFGQCWTVLDSVGNLDLLLFGEDTCALQKVTSGNYDCAFWLISLMTACSVFINFQGIKKVAGSKMKSRCRWPDICFCYKQNQAAVLGFVLVVVKQ